MTKWRLGVAQWCLDRQGVAAVYRAVESGVSVIHIDAGGAKGNPPLHEPAVQRAYAHALQETGITITGIAVNVVNDFGLHGEANSSETRKSWEAIRQAIEAAASMYVELVVLPSFRNSEIRCKRDLLRTAEMLRQACEYALNYQVNIATENSLNVGDNGQLLNLVDLSNLRVLIDTQNPRLWGHDVPELIEALQAYMCNQVHVKDGKDGMMGNCLLNRDQAELVAAMQTLHKIGFAGDIILENRYHQNTEKAIAHDIEVLNALLLQGRDK